MCCHLHTKELLCSTCVHVAIPGEGEDEVGAAVRSLVSCCYAMALW